MNYILFVLSLSLQILEVLEHPCVPTVLIRLMQPGLIPTEPSTRSKQQVCSNSAEDIRSMIRKCSEGDRNACTDQKNIRERKTIKYFKRAWKMDICKVKWGEVCRCITFCFVKKEQNRNQADRALSLITEKSIWYETVHGLMAPLGNLFTSYLKFGSVNVHLLPFTRQITIATHYYWGHFSNMASANLL